MSWQGRGYYILRVENWDLGSLNNVFKFQKLVKNHDSNPSLSVPKRQGFYIIPDYSRVCISSSINHLPCDLWDDHFTSFIKHKYK